MIKRLFLFVMMASVALLAADAPKYIFLFIGDGMSVPQRMLAEEYMKKVYNTEISFNHFPYQALTQTYAANSYVTDSAAAATAIACGEKTNNGVIGLDTKNQPLESVAYVAKKTGRKVGIITSVTINHATPSGFYGKRTNRSMYYELGLDLIASNFDFFGGGGVGGFNNEKSPEYKGDIYELAQKAGYKIATNREELQALKPADGKFLAYGSKSGNLKYVIDREENEKQPELCEFVEKAIELLDNPNGFFMMVEGGAIDYVGHANDAAANMVEVYGLDRAVRKALDFAAKHENETLIVVTGDHETGGMTMGFAGGGSHLNIERLALQRCSTATFAAKIKAAKDAKADFNFEDAKPLLTKWYGFKFDADKDPMNVTGKDLETLQNGLAENKLHDAARRVMMNKSGVGWTTGSHTALPVVTTARGVASENFQGTIENYDISRKLKQIIAK